MTVFSPTPEQPVKDLEAVFSMLHDAKVFKDQLKFLSHIVRGVETDPAKMTVMTDYPVLQDLKSLHRFLELVSLVLQIHSPLCRCSIPSESA